MSTTTTTTTTKTATTTDGCQMFEQFFGTSFQAISNGVIRFVYGSQTFGTIES